MSNVNKYKPLLGLGDMFNFIALISPFIITFLVIFAGNGALNILPGLGWFVSLLVAIILFAMMKKTFQTMNKNKRSDEQIMNQLKSVCNLFDTPWIDPLEVKGSIRMYFYAFTITYLSIHLAMSGIEDIGLPIGFIFLIGVLSLADIARLFQQKCTGMMEIFMSVLLGGIAGSLALVSGIIDDVMFFKQKSCVNNKKCK